jgi:hypothetical protein
MVITQRKEDKEGRKGDRQTKGKMITLAECISPQSLAITLIFKQA